LSERSELENLVNVRSLIDDALVDLKIALTPLLDGSAKNHEDPEELYHQLNDLLGIMQELASEDSDLVHILEDHF